MHLVGVGVQHHRELAEVLGGELPQVDALGLVLLLQKLQRSNAAVALNDQVAPAGQLTHQDLVDTQVAVGLEALDQVLDVLVLVSAKQAHRSLHHVAVLHLRIRHRLLIRLVNDAEVVRVQEWAAQADPPQVGRSLHRSDVLVRRRLVRHGQAPLPLATRAARLSASVR
jgi:hypothetical protein